MSTREEQSPQRKVGGKFYALPSSPSGTQAPPILFSVTMGCFWRKNIGMAVLSLSGAFLVLSSFLAQRATRVFRKRQAPFSLGKKTELITRSGEFLKPSLSLSQKKHERETSLSRAWEQQPIFLQEQLVGKTRRLCPTRSGCLMVGPDAHEQCPNVNDPAVIRVKS